MALTGGGAHGHRHPVASPTAEAAWTIDAPGVPNRTIARTYDRLSWLYDHAVAPMEAPTRARALALLDARPGESVLELGCGSGQALLALARQVGPDGRVVGLDAAPGMVERSRRRLRQAGVDDRAAVVLGDARRLPLDGPFDAVYTAETLELFSRSEARDVLAEASRVLRPEGRLCVASMDRAGHEASAFVTAYEWVYRNVPGYRRLGCRPIEVVATVEDAGFVVETVETDVRWGVWPTAIVVARPG